MGASYEEACSHALCEIIEHDALAMANLFNPKSWSFAIAPEAGVADSGICRPVVQDTTPDLLFPLIRIASFPHKALKIAEALQDAGLMVFVRNLTNDIGVPAVSCVLAEPLEGGTFRAYFGHGAHTDSEHALIRAMCEAAQSHSECHWMVGNGKMQPFPVTFGDPVLFHGYGSHCDFPDMPGYRFDGIGEEIRFLLQRLETCGLEQALVFDLTKQHIGFPVVRMVVPGAEYMVMEPSDQRLGRRGEQLLAFRKAAYLNLLNSTG